MPSRHSAHVWPIRVSAFLYSPIKEREYFSRLCRKSRLLIAALKLAHNKHLHSHQLHQKRNELPANASRTIRTETQRSRRISDVKDSVTRVNSLYNGHTQTRCTHNFGRRAERKIKLSNSNKLPFTGAARYGPISISARSSIFGQVVKSDRPLELLPLFSRRSAFTFINLLMSNRSLSRYSIHKTHKTWRQNWCLLCEALVNKKTANFSAVGKKSENAPNRLQY